MDKKEPIRIETEIPILEKKESKKSHSLLFLEKEKIYNIKFEFIPEEKNIIIKINDSDPKINFIYSVCLSLEDWNKLAPDPSIFKDILVVFKELEKIDKYNCSLNFHDNSLDLDIRLREYNYKEIKILLTEEKKEEEDLNHNKIIEENLNLKKENNRLEERVKFLENEIESLKSFLPYYLDKSLFQKLKSSQIIKKLQHLELINRGINNLFQKNIKDIIFKYEFNSQDKADSLSFFSNIYKYLDNLTNILLVVKTTKNRCFGVFYQIFRNDYNYNYNNYNNGNYPITKVVPYQNAFNYSVKTKNSIGNQISVENISSYFPNIGTHIINIKYKINIDPVQYPNSFFFSLDHLKIYNSQFNILEYPSFIIEYNNDKKIFCGTEKKNNNIKRLLESINRNVLGTYEVSKLHTKGGINNGINGKEIDYSFILSNQEQFENLKLEIYEIKI